MKTIDELRKFMLNVVQASKFEDTENGKSINLVSATAKPDAKNGAKGSQDLQSAIQAILSKSAAKMDQEIVKGG